MSNETELRDRIAALIDGVLVLGGGDEDAAQAIIDELGLTVEAGEYTCDYGLTSRRETRVVGRWEQA